MTAVRSPFILTPGRQDRRLLLLRRQHTCRSHRCADPRRPSPHGHRAGPVRRWDSGEAGSTSLELVVLAPVLLLVVAVLVFGGRVAIAGQAVQQAADESAREASIARTSTDARTTARAAAAATLAEQGLDCRATTITVDTTGFNLAPGRTANVRANVACQVRVSDLAIPGLPGTKTIAATAQSPIDTYRERR